MGANWCQGSVVPEIGRAWMPVMLGCVCGVGVLEVGALYVGCGIHRKNATHYQFHEYCREYDCLCPTSGKTAKNMSCRRPRGCGNDFSRGGFYYILFTFEFYMTMYTRTIDNFIELSYNSFIARRFDQISQPRSGQATAGA